VVSMGDVAASGGYYAACGADTIMANPGTTTGSIGVIAEFPSIDGLLEKVGIKVNVVKSGRYKDTGSPFRPLTDEDKTYLQSWIDDAYEQFVEVVAKERKLSKPKVLQLADGRVFTGRQAAGRPGRRAWWICWARTRTPSIWPQNWRVSKENPRSSR
jgi:protease IV